MQGLVREGPERDGPDAVSYTHLDVYKRQALVSRVASELMGLGLIREAAPGPRRRYRGAVSYTHLRRGQAAVARAYDYGIVMQSCQIISPCLSK